MANYEDENHQFSTILSIDDSGVWLENNLWGKFFTKRFDGSIDWDGWRTKHKPGDVIPVLRQERVNTYAYMTGFDLRTAKEKLRDFIDQEKQDAVVTSVVHVQSNIANNASTQVQAYSPVWKSVYYESHGMIGVQRGDIATFSRTKDEQGFYKYRLVENKTVKEIINTGIARILKDFNKLERDRILLLSENIRLGLEK